MPVRRVLAAVDLGPQGETVARAATSLAAQTDATLTLLHAVQPPPVPGDIAGALAPPVVPPISHDRLADQARDEVAALAEEQARHVAAHARVLLHRDPATAIADAAEEEESDLIVIGSAQRSGLHRLFAGSVAESTLRIAPCPVLVVPTDG